MTADTIAIKTDWERQFKIPNRLFVTPEFRNKMNPKLSYSGWIFLSVCGVVIAYTGFLVQGFGEMEKIFNCSLNLDAKICLLDLKDNLPTGFPYTHVSYIVLSCAKKCNLSFWITDKAPSVNQ